MIWIRNYFHLLLQTLVACISILFIQYCAVIKVPSGGPKDMTPPYILNVSPSTGSLNYKGEKIVIQFSEYMNPKSIENGIRIFPNIKGELPILINGDIVTIDFPDVLELNQTYVVNLSRNITDEHGVELTDAISLAYSTGDKISKGSISGIVYGEGKSAVHLWKIKDYKNLHDIFLTEPNYITDVSNKGKFNFQYLSKADYLILSLDRNFAGMPINTNRMPYGLNWNKIITLQSDQHLLNVHMFKGKAKSELKLLSGEWYGEKWGRIFFNQSLKNINEDYKLKIIYDNKVNTPVASFIDPEDENSLIFLDPSLIEAPKDFKMIINDFYIDGNTYLDSASLNIFLSELDTSLIKITSPKSDIKIAPTNSNEEDYIELKFSKPIPADKNFDYQFFKNDTIEVKEKVKIVNPMQINIAPRDSWDPRTNYLLIFKDNILQDTTIELNINTLNYVRHGGLQIPIKGTKISSIAAEIGNIENKELRKVSFVNSENEIIFDRIPEGKYTITIFNDINNDDEYSFGTVNPFIPAEWFYVMSDTIEIRGNWDIELPTLNVEEVYK